MDPPAVRQPDDLQRRSHRRAAKVIATVHPNVAKQFLDAVGVSFRGLLGTRVDVLYDDASCLAALRAAADCLEDPPLRVVDYQRWRKGRAEPTPNDQVIRWRFESWAAALRAAGLPSMREPYRPKGPSGASRPRI